MGTRESKYKGYLILLEEGGGGGRQAALSISFVK